MLDMTEVARVSSEIEAHIIAGMLESNGIGAVVSVDDGGGTEPQWQLTTGVRVLVAHDDAPDAQELIAESSGS
jgi:Putative prokaryotic signal transducing protein